MHRNCGPERRNPLPLCTTMAPVRRMRTMRTALLFLVSMFTVYTGSMFGLACPEYGRCVRSVMRETRHAVQNVLPVRPADCNFFHHVPS